MTLNGSKHSSEDIIAGLEAIPIVQDEGPESGALSTVESVQPYYADNSAKTAYMAYRGSGFTKREALDMLPRTVRQLYRWYEDDPEFKTLDDEGINEFREKTARHFAFADFLKNWRMTMQRDTNLLRKSLVQPSELDAEDRRDLRGIRGHYTPENLAKVTAYLKGKEGEDGRTLNIIALINAVAEEQAGPMEIYDAHVEALDAAAPTDYQETESSPSEERIESEPDPQAVGES